MENLKKVEYCGCTVGNVCTRYVGCSSVRMSRKFAAKVEFNMSVESMDDDEC